MQEFIQTTIAYLKVAALILIGLTFIFALIKMWFMLIPINFKKACFHEKWVKKALDKYANKIVGNDYKKRKKDITTSKGELRSDYIKECDKVKKNVAAKIECNKGFSDDFRKFAYEKYDTPRRKDIYRLLTKYLKVYEKRMQNNIKAFSDNAEKITPSEFFKLKQEYSGDIVGVYIIHNVTKDMYYVGQAKKLLFRINQHLTGHGNGDVYADLKYGDEFTVSIITLKKSGYDDIDKLEKDLILKYKAFESGYNRNAGNK